ncbi:MAG: hypothetical protein KAS02_01735 [Candidatus Pacebacteria bacterium]|nr:hypothetical protein [Candidatus Paceibacterota bacterium]
MLRLSEIRRNEIAWKCFVREILKKGLKDKWLCAEKAGISSKEYVCCVREVIKEIKEKDDELIKNHVFPETLSFIRRQHEIAWIIMVTVQINEKIKANKNSFNSLVEVVKDCNDVHRDEQIAFIYELIIVLDKVFAEQAPT